MSEPGGKRPAEPPIVPCPSCGRPVRWEPASHWRPFCSERCRLLDLGGWASGKYRIPEAEPDGGDESSGEA